MSPALVTELAHLLVAGASREQVESLLAREQGAPPVEPILKLGERVRRTKASAEQAALALGLIVSLGAVVPPDTAER